MTSELAAIACGIFSAVAWGAGDFSGGFATRKSHALVVVFFSQVTGIILLMTAGLAIGTGPGWETAPLLWGGVAGLCGTFGLVSLYTGLAQGTMGIVAPLSAVLTGIIPLGFSLAAEGFPGRGRLAGFGLAMVAIFFLSFSGGKEPVRSKEIQLSLMAGLGFGLFFVTIDQAVTRNVIWPLVAARMSSLCLLSVMLGTSGRLKLPPGNQLPFVILAGALDAAGNVLFALAAHLGRLDVSAVLASLYPASTVFLAWLFLRERLKGRQWMGVLSAIAALGLISI